MQHCISKQRADLDNKHLSDDEVIARECSQPVDVITSATVKPARWLQDKWQALRSK